MIKEKEKRDQETSQLIRAHERQLQAVKNQKMGRYALGGAAALGIAAAVATGGVGAVTLGAAAMANKAAEKLKPLAREAGMRLVNDLMQQRPPHLDPSSFFS